MSAANPPHSASNVPRRLPSDADPHKLSSMKNIKQGSSMVNRMAKRDPALYPLAFVMVGVAGACGYFFTKKFGDTHGDLHLAQSGSMVHPWDDKSKHDVHADSTAAFKYRYKTPQGHMEDAHPVLNSSTHKVNNPSTKWSTTN